MRFNRVLFRRKPLTVRLRKEYLQLFSWYIPEYRLRVAFDWQWLCRSLPFADFWVAEHRRWRAWSLYFFFWALPFVTTHTEYVLRKGGHLSQEAFSHYELMSFSLGLFVAIRFLASWMQRFHPSMLKALIILLESLTMLVFFSGLLYKWYL